MREMKKVMVMDKPGGGVRVRNFNPALVDTLISSGHAATEDEAIVIISASVPKGGDNPEIVESGNLPYFGNLRNALKRKNGGGLEIDMAKAREIKTESIRRERNKRLADLDVKYIRADESGNANEKIRISGQKQKLRDLPLTIQTELEAIASPEMLDNWEPVWSEYE